MAAMDKLKVLVFASMLLNFFFLGWMMVYRETVGRDKLAYVAVFQGGGQLSRGMFIVNLRVVQSIGRA